MTPDLHEVFAADGPLAARLPGFAPRPKQQEMAAAIADALAGGRQFIAESGTGTGKTFAYLVPALLAGKKIIISSGTRNLQDQLYHRDLPLVRDALRLPITMALLKGRANYLCRHRLESASSALLARDMQADLQHITAWSRRTRSGDIAEVADVPEGAEVWPHVTSTADNCLGTRCTSYDDCFVNRARRAALEADVLVVNHYLFFADLALKEDGFGQLLPGAQAVIFDEAHQLPEIASNFFGIAVSGHQLNLLCRDALAEEFKERSGIEALRPAIADVERATADLRLALGAEVRRDLWERIAEGTTAVTARAELHQRLAQLATVLDVAGAKGEGLAQCARRAADLLDRMIAITECPPPEHVLWFETTAHGFMLRLTPLNVARLFRAHVQANVGDRPRAWIFTSATLAIGDDFSLFQAQLGLDEADTAVWESPFDYATQALLYLPSGLPEPSMPTYTARVVDAAVPVLRASGGRAFFLFTSYRALRQAAELLRARVPYPLLIQGSMPRAQLLERFVAAGDAVLLATASFWEGVDVRGQALSCVIIDKLPFASPDDPLTRTRAAVLEEEGRSAFAEYQLPQAVISLKQGVGRLIRDAQDRGVLMLCDPRLLTKGYGKTFLSALPPMPRTRAIADVEQFFATIGSVSV